ncbi:MAG: hypothetical protein K2N01_04660 [Lachnospiraceae bacterium]|nr:hypothetical protein [Lachnospiraceae bacterium]
MYYEKLKQAKNQDCYHKALIYILGISGDTRKHFSRIYDMKTGRIKTECLHEGWQTSGSARVVKLRYPKYCQKQKSAPEILAEMEERKNAENPVNGDKE